MTLFTVGCSPADLPDSSNARDSRLAEGVSASGRKVRSESWVRADVALCCDRADSVDWGVLNGLVGEALGRTGVRGISCASRGKPPLIISADAATGVDDRRLDRLADGRMARNCY